MKLRTLGLAALMAGVASGGAFAQDAGPPSKDDITVDQLVQSAKVLAGLEWTGAFRRLCVPNIATADRIMPEVNSGEYPNGPSDNPSMGSSRNPDGSRNVDYYYAEPQQIGENLYFVGEREHNSYALVADNGDIVLFDGLYEEMTEIEIFEGLRKLGLDPADVKYQIIAHAHGDHDGGVYYTQQTYPWITIIYGPGDWPAVLAREGNHAVRNGPENDGYDGRVIEVGSDVKIDIYETPGHTPGTISAFFDYRDLNGVTRHAVYAMGLSISFTNTDPEYYDVDIAAARRMQHLVVDYGAEVLFGNHTEFDGGFYNAAILANRLPGDTYDPFVVGMQDVLDYFGVIELCNMATKLRATGSL